MLEGCAGPLHEWKMQLQPRDSIFSLEIALTRARSPFIHAFRARLSHVVCFCVHRFKHSHFKFFFKISRMLVQFFS